MDFPPLLHFGRETERGLVTIYCVDAHSTTEAVFHKLRFWGETVLRSCSKYFSWKLFRFIFIILHLFILFFIFSRCKKHEVPLEKVYNKTQREKFAWAIDMAEKDFVFWSRLNST